MESFDWRELVAVVVAAAVGWFARHFDVWLPPRRPGGEDDDD